MSGLRSPGLGPIVGHTTPTSCRISIRAGDPSVNGACLDSQRRTVGVISLYEGANSHIETSYFRLHREFDRTGTFNLGGDVTLFSRAEKTNATPLKPDTHYTARVGTLTLDDPIPDDASLSNTRLKDYLPDPSIWRSEIESLPEDRSKAEFSTFPKQADNLSFLLGSCRYPGLLWKAKRADKIFGPIFREAGKQGAGGKPRFTIMAGDQIYADTLNRFLPLGRADTYDEFQERYVTAFGSPNMSRLLSAVPTYMILDDHEIEDNWSQDRVRRDGKYGLFTIAVDAYMSYQWSHGPHNFGRRLFYTFECGGYPFFVLDTRTQRFYDDDDGSLGGNHMLGYPSFDPAEPAQIDRLLSWLRDQDKRAPKFIVTSSVFAPNPMRARYSATPKRKEESDSWPGFPETRRAILNCVLENEIQNVVFLSGDIHCANVAEITFQEKKNGSPIPIRMFSITSSAFYWPFPFADGEPSHYVHDSRHAKQLDPFYLGADETESGPVMHCRAWNFTQEDNYCRIDIDREKAKLVVRTFDDDGNLIRNEGGRSMRASLKLEPW